MTSSDLLLTNMDNSTQDHLKINAIEGNLFSSTDLRHFKRTDLTVDEEMIGPAQELPSKVTQARPSNSFFRIRIKSHYPFPQTFRLELPPLVVNGAKRELPVVIFEHARYEGITPLMC